MAEAYGWGDYPIVEGSYGPFPQSEPDPKDLGTQEFWNDQILKRRMESGSPVSEKPIPDMSAPYTSGPGIPGTLDQMNKGTVPIPGDQKYLSPGEDNMFPWRGQRGIPNPPSNPRIGLDYTNLTWDQFPAVA